MGDTPEVPKPALVKLAFSAILDLLGMITWGVGSIPFNVQAKVECYENLAIVIQVIQARCAKAFKGAWNERD
jgi:hypothetical protein